VIWLALIPAAALIAFVWYVVAGTLALYYW
jgi:hypothetical protein